MNDTFFKRLLFIAALIGAIGVMAGAFGAHFLKNRLPEGDMETIKTGVFYLFIHVLATIGIVTLALKGNPSRKLKSVGILFLLGILLFSGSLFLIGTQSLSGIPASSIGIVTPIGGLCFISGWVLLGAYSLKEYL